MPTNWAKQVSSGAAVASKARSAFLMQSVLAAAEANDVREVSCTKRANWRSNFRQQIQRVIGMPLLSRAEHIVRSAAGLELEHSAMHTEQKRRRGDLEEGKEKVES